MNLLFHTGCILILLNAVNIISALRTCYPVNGQRYCFYSDDSKLSWADARQFCAIRNSTLPIITDEHIDRVFQQFISDNNIVSGSDAGQTGNYTYGLIYTLTVLTALTNGTGSTDSLPASTHAYLYLRVRRLPVLEHGL